MDDCAAYQVAYGLRGPGSTLTGHGGPGANDGPAAGGDGRAAMRVHTGATPDTAAAGAARTASGGPPPENSPPLEQQLGRWASDRPHEGEPSCASAERHGSG